LVFKPQEKKFPLSLVSVRELHLCVDKQKKIKRRKNCYYAGEKKKVVVVGWKKT
jgi:hypothetical protein